MKGRNIANMMLVVSFLASFQCADTGPGPEQSARDSCRNGGSGQGGREGDVTYSCALVAIAFRNRTATENDKDLSLLLCTYALFRAQLCDKKSSYPFTH